MQLQIGKTYHDVKGERYRTDIYCRVVSIRDNKYYITWHTKHDDMQFFDSVITHGDIYGHLTLESYNTKIITKRSVIA